jgi:hypothetical protein
LFLGFRSIAVFVDPVGCEIAFGLFPMTATGAVEGSIARVTKGAVASADWGLAIRLGALGRIPDGDPLGIAFEPTSHSCFSFRPLPLLRQGVLCLIPAPIFFRAALTP